MDICMVLDFIHPVLLFKASFITIFDGLVGHLHDILDHVRKVWAYPHEISQSIQLYIYIIYIYICSLYPHLYFHDNFILVDIPSENRYPNISP